MKLSTYYFRRMIPLEFQSISWELFSYTLRFNMVEPCWELNFYLYLNKMVTSVIVAGVSYLLIPQGSPSMTDDNYQY